MGRTWIVYASAETGRPEVYVRRFPGGAPVVRVSPDGGYSPVWSPDGQQLFYVRPIPETQDKQVMVVDVVTDPTFRSRAPRLLFESPYEGSAPIRSFDVSPAGDRFVLKRPVESEPQSVTEINLVLNWFEELKRLVPTE